MRPKRALITGITGQDGSFLTELLLSKAYEVYGVIRRASTFNTDRIDHLYADPHEEGARLRLVYGDLADGSSLNKMIRTIEPDEIYNLGAQSHVRVSFDIPEYTAEVTGLGTIRLLEGIRETGLTPRFYQASSSELFGNTTEVPQNEGPSSTRAVPTRVELGPSFCCCRRDTKCTASSGEPARSTRIGLITCTRILMKRAPACDWSMEISPTEAR